MIRTFLTHWDRFFHREVPPHLLAFVRIALGLFVMLYWYTEWSDARLFSVEGALDPIMVFDGPVSFALFHPQLWFVQCFFAVTFLFLCFFTVGLLTRTSALFMLIALTYFHFLSQWMFMASYYRLFCFAFAVFLLPGGDRAFSVAMRLRHGSFLAWEPISIFPQRLLALQVTATYFCVSWQKLFISDWYSGKILLEGFTGRWGTPFGFFLARMLPRSVIDLMLYGSVFFECLMPFAFWIRRALPYAFVFGFLFHTMITLTLGIWWFQFLVPLYVVFLDPAEVFGFFRSYSGGRIPEHGSRLVH